MEVADYYREAGEYEAAANRYRQLLDEFAGVGLDAEALYKLGSCYQAVGRHDEASYIFDVILRHYNEEEVATPAEQAVPEAN